MKHTKGNWEAIGNQDNSYSIFGDKEDGAAESVATVHGNELMKNLANAKLIAAAPELLEALNCFVNWYECKEPEEITGEHIREIALNAIKKATEWIEKLTGEQIKDALFNCMQELIITDEVIFDEDGAPYWEASGNKITDN